MSIDTYRPRLHEAAIRVAEARASDEGGLRFLHAANILHRSTQMLTLDRPLLILVLQGHKLVQMPDGPRAIDAGGLLFAPARSTVALTHIPVDGAYEACCLMMPSHLLLQALADEPGVIDSLPSERPWSVPAHDATLQAVTHLLEGLAEPGWHPHVVQWRLRELIGTMCLLRGGRLEGQPAARSWKKADVVAGVRSLVRSEPASRWSIGSVSKHLATSPSTLKRRLLDAGHTFDGLLWHERVFLARALLDDPGMSVSEVAGRCGYASSSKFAIRFRTETGMSPTEWRRSRPPQPIPELS